MTTMMCVIFVVLIAALVFASGWRLCPPPHEVTGGLAAFLLFLLHPAMASVAQQSSLWDILFVMLFVTAWFWLEHWSLFMRSWVLAGIFGFGLWMGSPFVMWILVAMVPWVLFNRRPADAVVSLLTIFFGGLFFFSTTWVLIYFLAPTVGRPLFNAWFRWGGLQIPASVSLPWCLLVIILIYERLKEMVQDRRSDAITFSAMLLVLTVLFGSPRLGLALVALSAPLLARSLVKREFLYHRGVRWLIASTFILTLILSFALSKSAWMIAALSMVLVGISSRGPYGNSKVPWRLSVEAICVGAYAAEFIGILLAR